MALVVAAFILCCAAPSRAVTNVFFNASQTATVLTTNMTSTTIISSGYTRR